MPLPETRPAAVLPEKITLGQGKNKTKNWLLVPGQGARDDSVPVPAPAAQSRLRRKRRRMRGSRRNNAVMVTRVSGAAKKSIIQLKR